MGEEGHRPHPQLWCCDMEEDTGERDSPLEPRALELSLGERPCLKQSMPKGIAENSRVLWDEKLRGSW